jgi:hypothetical protein
MLISEMVNLSALAATHAQALLELPALPSCELEAYWTASRSRHDRWFRALRTTAEHVIERRLAWRSGDGLEEEILIGEMLTRVWTGLVLAHVRRHGDEAAASIARNVLSGQLESRRRALRLLMHVAGVRADRALWLNRLRRKTERWTDLLLAGSCHILDFEELAVDPERARGFLQDFHDSQQGHRTAWRLYLDSFRAAFCEVAVLRSPNDDLNARIVSSIANCFPDGHLRAACLGSLWRARMLGLADHAQGMLDELIDSGRPAET